MTEQPAYWVDAYVKEIETTVLDSGSEDGSPWVELEDTVLFPEGGGQPWDRGWIQGVLVTAVRKEGGRILHSLDGAAPEGRVSVRLDWDRRFDHMQQHTAQHLLTAVAEDLFGWKTTAFHLGQEISDVELDVPCLDSAQLRELEAAVSAELRESRSVTSRWHERGSQEAAGVRCRGLPQGHSGPLRLVEIENVDLAACSGTHLRSTAEIETLCLTGTEQLRGGTRVFFVAGGRVRRRMAENEERNRDLRGLLGAPDADLPATVEAKLLQLKDEGRDRRREVEELAIVLALELARRDAPLLSQHFRWIPAAVLRKLATEFARLGTHGCLFLTSEDGSFVLADASSEPRAGELGPALLPLLDARGGGKGALYQGTAKAMERIEEAKEILEKLL